jgi:hypothetical protein
MHALELLERKPQLSSTHLNAHPSCQLSRTHLNSLMMDLCSLLQKSSTVHR